MIGKTCTTSFLALALGIEFFASSFVHAGQVTVYLKSGRRFNAEVSQRTNDETLWLRFGTDTTILLRPIRWSHVQRVQYQGKEISVAQLRSLVDEIASPADLELPAERKGSLVFAHRQRDADHAQNGPGSPAPVATVSFYAQIANWDRDVEPDGLVLGIEPLGVNGDVVPVSGTLSVDLLASRRRSFNDVPHGRGSKFESLGRWVRQLTPQEMTVRLPFQSHHPAFDTDWSTHALVHVRLSVPGHGVFEDSVDPVRVRHGSPIRDELELKEDRRFFPIEGTGRGTR
jgi:hypothetical protein